MDYSSDNRNISRSARWWIRGCWAVGVLLFVSQLIEIPERSALRGYDNTFNYLWLRSAMVDGDWDFRNDLEQCDTLTSEYRVAALAMHPTPTGRLPNKYGVGWAIVTLPFYLLADGVVALGRVCGVWSWERDGFNAVYQVFIQTGHAALAILALMLATKVVRGWVGATGAAEAVLVVWAASSLLYYQTSNLSMSHGVAFFAVALGAYGLLRAQSQGVNSWGGWWLAGIGFGLAVVTRFQLGIFLLWPGLVICSLWRERAELAGAALLRFAAGSLPFFMLQVWAWHVVYGRWLVFSYGEEGEGFNWGHPEFFGSLFSPWHGLYYWHPFLIFATAGLLAWAWKKRGFASGVVLLFCFTVYLNAAWWCWWFGSAFGNRAYDAALLPLMAGTAWIFQRLGDRWRGLFWTAAGSAAVWNLYVVLLYRTATISRQEPVTWVQMTDAFGQLWSLAGF